MVSIICDGQNTLSHTVSDDVLNNLTKQFGLTPKERDIVKLILSYRTNEEICDELNVKNTTLQKHFQNIFRKMNVASRLELLKSAYRN